MLQIFMNMVTLEQMGLLSILGVTKANILIVLVLSIFQKTLKDS